MKLISIEDFHTDGGWEPFSFLKLGTDDGLVGWAEFNEARGRRGLSHLIRGMAEGLLGQDPREVGRIEAQLYAATRSTAGGMQSHAIAAIVNACLDLKGKALGVPVHELFGGALRRELPVYWSHCGMFRARYPQLFEDVIGRPAVRSLDDLRALGREVKERGYRALKTNTIVFGGAESPRVHGAGFGRGPGHPELNAEPAVVDAIAAQMAALREGAGDGVELMIDLNFNFKPDGLRRIARALEPLRMTWMEADLYSPNALAALRQSTSTPIASLEAVLGRRALKPYLDAEAADVAIMDVQWNGFPEACRMAALADTYEVNVASHCSSGPLSTLISAHFCAVIPNFKIMEIDVDEVPWRRQLLTHPFELKDGRFVLPSRPGWGSDIDEATALAHPAK